MTPLATMPAGVAQIRRDLCPACQCGANPQDPCATCPEGRWSTYVHCPGDEAPPAIAHAPNQPAPPSPATPGPGTLLKKSLAKIGIHPAPGCQCNARAALMDHNGPEWCAANIETIVTWLREESTRAHLPFVPLAARLLIQRCIRRARALQANLSLKRL